MPKNLNKKYDKKQFQVSFQKHNSSLVVLINFLGN